MAFDLTAILVNPPRLHVHHRTGERISDWRIDDLTSHELDARLRPGMTTLETGAGLSTIIFASKTCQHTCIAPDADLIERIKHYCLENDISTDSVKFIIAKSYQVLHGLVPNSFDLVLIDGNHGFPSVFVDFFYMAKALKMGGILIQDDMHIYTCRLVAEFMREDPGWQLKAFTNRIAIAKKLSDTIETDWISQPLNVRRSYPVHKHPVVFARAILRSLVSSGPRTTLQKIRNRLR